MNPIQHKTRWNTAVAVCAVSIASGKKTPAAIAIKNPDGAYSGTLLGRAGSTSIGLSATQQPGPVNWSAHNPAPLFFSSLGYGLAVNTHAYAYFDVGFAVPANATGKGEPGVHMNLRNLSNWSWLIASPSRGSISNFTI